MTFPLVNQSWRQAGAGLLPYSVPLAQINAPRRPPALPLAPPPVVGGGGGGFPGMGAGDGDTYGSGDNPDHTGSVSYTSDNAPDWLKAVYGALPGLATGGLLGGAFGAAKSLAGNNLSQFANNIRTGQTGTLGDWFQNTFNAPGPEGYALPPDVGRVQPQPDWQNVGGGGGDVWTPDYNAAYQPGAIQQQQLAEPSLVDRIQSLFSGAMASVPQVDQQQIPAPAGFGGAPYSPTPQDEANLAAAYDAAGNGPQPEDNPDYWSGWWMDDQGNSGWN